MEAVERWSYAACGQQSKNMNEAKFQACPFCGSEPTITDTGTHNGIRWLVRCDNALCGVNPYARSMNHDRALAIWNQRAGGREPDADKTAEAKHVGSSEIVLLLREQLNDLFLASSLLRTRIHTHGKTVMNFEDYKRHTASMLKTEKVLHQMQQNNQALRSAPTADVERRKESGI